MGVERGRDGDTASAGELSEVCRDRVSAVHFLDGGGPLPVRHGTQPLKIFTIVRGQASQIARFARYHFL